jgi:hypothetical protein
VAYGVFGADAHKFTASGEALKIWAPRVDDFLGRLGMPNAILYPQFLPAPPPPASHFAAIGDAAAVPYLNDAGRALYRKYLTETKPRAFVISPHDIFAETGGFDPMARGLRLCREKGADCGVYAYDDDVVWTGPRAAAAGPRLYQVTVAAGATTTLIFAYSVRPDCTTRGPTRILVTQPPAHGAAAASPGVDFPKFRPAGPFAVCNAGRVPGTALTYTPAAGCAGPDALTFEEIMPNTERKVLRRLITVK